MEEKIKELERKVEILSGVVFVILKETGMLEKALGDNIMSAVKKVAEEDSKVEQDKSKCKSIDEFASVLEDFDAEKAIKN